jgi:hypothetical protein
MMIKVNDLLGWVIPDPEKCRAEANRLTSEHPDKSIRDLAQLAVNDAQGWAMTAGAATGAFASPITMVPAALADMSAVLKLEGTMAGTIAALLEPESMLDAEAFEADVLTVVFPGAVSQALRQLGVRVGQHFTKELVRRALGTGVAKSAGRFAARHLLINLTEKAILAKTVPLVGAGIGAGWNWLELKVVGRRAIAYYLKEPIGPAGERFAKVRRLIRGLPWRKGKGDDAPESPE